MRRHPIPIMRTAGLPCALLILVGCVAGVQPGVQPAPCAVASQSVFLAAPAGFEGTFLTIAAGDGPSHQAQVDTGSTGIAIRRDSIKTFTPTESALPDFIYYNSSGNLMCGEWVSTSVTLSGRNNAQVSIPSIQVLAIDHICNVQPPLPANPCQSCTGLPLPPAGGPAMLGVGFGRGMAGPAQNAFLQVAQMNAGTMQRGYIVTTDGIRLGMKPADVSGFRFVPLTANGDDWQQASGCVSVQGGGVATPGQQVCGDTLMDTGVNRMFVSYVKQPAFDPPLTPPEDRLWSCCGIGLGILPCVDGKPACVVNGGGAASVTVTWPGSGTPPFTYTATAPPEYLWNGTSPILVHVNDNAQLPDPNEQVFVNTSRQLLFTADYLYDATCGRIGFRPKPAKTSK